MMLFKNFRIRRHLCEQACGGTAVLLVVNKTDQYTGRRYYCPEHEYKGLYWAGKTGAKTYRDSGAR